MMDPQAWRRFSERLGVEHSIIQAPMAGGLTPPELVAAVSEAGGLGSLGAAYVQPEDIVQQARAVRSLTSRPYAINLFAPQPAVAPSDPGPTLAIIERFHAALGLPPPVIPATAMPDFAKQVEAVLEAAPTVFSFTFGIPPAPVLEAFRSRGILVVGTATNVREAQALEAAGVDAIVAQGSEAGGHRGSFGGSFEAGMVGTMALVPQMVDAVRVPVIASGGIMDGRGISAARMLGAAAVQLGTAFLRCQESSAAAAHKALLREARDESSRITRAFSGRPARAIPNELTTTLEEAGAILPFPQQHGATRTLRAASSKQNDTRFMALWAGQGIGLSREGPAADLVRALVAETDAALSAVRG
ncbi:nitronate monooxygenase [Corallococcus sp. AB011P]|uniref:NAD(P)H-dependent flavin oxidoreductase n=1 Tax=Corallococcus sp. AB011P TaxID=2316735 RepID=UPI000EA0B642|nr:nitronate monooxygenase [Corallococcus sp. AB011P]RKG60774.1 nitronate monooxygenase [Corallococcus sp. AB011P]